MTIPFLNINQLLASPIIITACLITKNDGDRLERCLSSIQDFVDEIVIVDLYSHDNTLDIAKSFDAKIVQQQWQYNTALHRNQTIDYALGDWVFIIDPDEELFLGNQKNIKNYLNTLSEEYSAITLKEYDKQNILHHNCCIFRRRDIQYKGQVHPLPYLTPNNAKTLIYPNIYLKPIG